jgi:Fe-S-cluster-containing dehydrogenase component
MSAEIKTTKHGFMDEEVTRRQFMKISGKTLAGLTLSASMLKLFGCTTSQVNRGLVSTRAMHEGILVVNKDVCLGCVRCEAFCTLLNDGAVSSHNARLKVTRNLMSNKNGVGMYADLQKGWVCFPDTCRQCNPAPCMQRCPFNAIYSVNGVTKVDEAKCTACRLCIPACPWQMININTISGKAAKCNNCGECVKRCITGALKFVPWDAVTAAAQAHWQG